MAFLQHNQCTSLPIGLSDAQSRVLRLVAQGRSNAEIAKTLGILTATVGNHACQGCHRLGIKAYNRADRRQQLIAHFAESPDPAAAIAGLTMHHTAAEAERHSAEVLRSEVPITMEDPFF